MIGSSTEKCRQQPLAAGTLSRLSRGLQGNEHGVNFGQNLRIGDRQDPALLGLVLFGQGAQVLGHLGSTVSFSPNIKGVLAVLRVLGGEVVGIEN